MKKLTQLFLAFVLLMTALVPAVNVSAEEDKSLQRVEDAGVLKVAASGTLFPIAYYNEDNELVGYYIDVIREVADIMGVEVEVQEMGVDGMLTAVESGLVDVVAEGMSMTKERLEHNIFADPMVYSVGTAVVRAEDDSGISSLEDFEGKKAAGAATTNYMAVAKEFGAIPVAYDNATNEQYFMDLTAGRTDFIPNDYFTIKSAIQFYGDQYPIKMADVFYNPDKGSYLFKKDSVALRDAFNDALNQLRESGRLSEIAKEYYNGEDPSQPLEEVNGIPIEEVPVVEYEN